MEKRAAIGKEKHAADDACPREGGSVEGAEEPRGSGCQAQERYCRYLRQEQHAHTPDEAADRQVEGREGRRRARGDDLGRDPETEDGHDRRYARYRTLRHGWAV